MQDCQSWTSQAGPVMTSSGTSQWTSRWCSRTLQTQTTASLRIRPPSLTALRPLQSIPCKSLRSLAGQVPRQVISAEVIERLTVRKLMFVIISNVALLLKAEAFWNA